MSVYRHGAISSPLRHPTVFYGPTLNPHMHHKHNISHQYNYSAFPTQKTPALAEAVDVGSLGYCGPLVTGGVSSAPVLGVKAWEQPANPLGGARGELGRPVSPNCWVEVLLFWSLFLDAGSRPVQRDCAFCFFNFGRVFESGKEQSPLLAFRTSAWNMPTTFYQPAVHSIYYSVMLTYACLEVARQTS